MRKNYFYNLLLTVFNLVIPIISFPYVARVLGPEGVGNVQFILTLSQYIALLSALGIPIYGIREIARHRHSPILLSRRFSELVAINLLTGLVFAAIYFSLVLMHPFFREDQRLFLYAGLTILISFTSVDWFYSGMELFKKIALRSASIKLLSLMLILVFVRKGNDQLPYLLISMLSLLGNNVINFISVSKLIKIRLTTPNLKKHFKPLVFILGTTIASTLYTTFDSILLGFLSGKRAVGLYAAAGKIAKIAIPIVMAYGGVLIPSITQSFKNKKNTDLQQILNRSYAYISMLSIPISVGLFAFAPSLIVIFSGKNFSEAILTMKILSPLPLVIGMGYFWGYQVILPLGKDKLLLYAAIVGMVFSLSFNLLLVPALQENGAAIANVGSEILVTLCYFLLIKRYLQIKLKHIYLLESAISSIPFLLFLPASSYLPNSIFIVALWVIACVLLYFALQFYVFKNIILFRFVNRYKSKLNLHFL